MSMKKFITTSFAVIAIVGMTNAQSIVNGELKSLLEKSLTYFPKVKEVELSVQQAENRLKLTELNKYPDVTIDASYAYVKPKIEVPFGVSHFAMVIFKRVSGVTLITSCTEPLPKLCAPTSFARSLSCIAPANISEAEAEPPSIKITNFN